MTPLQTPITLTININTQEELRAFILRANLDANNIREWYHDKRQRPNVVCPDVGLKSLYKALKERMVAEGMAIEEAPAVAEEAEPVAPPRASITIG